MTSVFLILAAALMALPPASWRWSRATRSPRHAIASNTDGGPPAGGMPAEPGSVHRLRWRLVCVCLVLAIAWLLSDSLYLGGGSALVFVTALPAFDAVAHRRALRREQDRRLRELPLAVDLFGSALACGLTVPDALAAAASTCWVSTRQELSETAGLLRLGAAPQDAWAALRTDPVLGALAEVAIRSADSGTRLARACGQLAVSLRARSQTRREAVARRAGVFAMIPLGLCFLPAFLCLGVVPVVIGVSGDVLTPVLP